MPAAFAAELPRRRSSTTPYLQHRSPPRVSIRVYLRLCSSDGKFELFSYRVARTNHIPIYVTPNIRCETRSRSEDAVRDALRGDQRRRRLTSSDL